MFELRMPFESTQQVPVPIA